MQYLTVVRQKFNNITITAKQPVINVAFRRSFRQMQLHYSKSDGNYSISSEFNFICHFSNFVLSLFSTVISCYCYPLVYVGPTSFCVFDTSVELALKRMLH